MKISTTLVLACLASTSFVMAGDGDESALPSLGASAMASIPVADFERSEFLASVGQGDREVLALLDRAFLGLSPEDFDRVRAELEALDVTGDRETALARIQVLAELGREETSADSSVSGTTPPEAADEMDSATGVATTPAAEATTQETEGFEGTLASSAQVEGASATPHAEDAAQDSIENDPAAVPASQVSGDQEADEITPQAETEGQVSSQPSDDSALDDQDDAYFGEDQDDEGDEEDDEAYEREANDILGALGLSELADQENDASA